jgi:ATP/maltotriose-dependent transcriptional regulator MalT
MLSVLAKIQDLELPGYLRMAIVTRESVRLRFQGDHDQSDVLIRDALKSINIDSEDIRLHYAYGRLLLSRSENAILCNDLSGARKCIENWYLNREYPSILELEVVRLKTTVLTRIDRYEGNFQNANTQLNLCLNLVKQQPSDAVCFHIMHHLGDVYYELRKPKKAQNLLLHEFKHLRACGKQRTKAFRRLALPLAEAYLEQGKLV